MKYLIPSLMFAAIAAASTPAVGQTCPANSQTPGDPCPGAASSQCVPSKCPAGSIVVGPRRNRRVSASLIQSAINAASASVPSTICAKPATYLVTSTLNFEGKPIDLVAASGATLQGNGKITVVEFVSNESSASVLDGFTVTGGSATTGSGGGIYIVNASPTIKNCLVTGNAAPVISSNQFPRGGGLLVLGSEAAPSILCTTFSNNTSGYVGGGFDTAYLAHPNLDYVTFQGNSAPYGGGFAASFNGGANIENSLFLDNTASFDGGAMHVLTQWGHTFVRRSVFDGNTAGGNGAAAWVPGGFATFLNSGFYHNNGTNGMAPAAGGAVAAGLGSTVSVMSSILENNCAVTPTTTVFVLQSEPPGDNTNLINSYNMFGDNFCTNSLNTLPTSNSFSFDVIESFVGCYCLPQGSACIAKGMPDPLFNNAYNNQTNDCGAHGGPTASVGLPPVS
jgi:hypothetical protein